MALEEKLYQYLDRLKVRYPLVAFIVDVIEVYLDRRVSALRNWLITCC